MEMKHCSRCNRDKDIDKFQRNEKIWKMCNVCNEKSKSRKEYYKIYRIENKEAISARLKQYYNNNKETMLAYNKQYYSDNWQLCIIKESKRADKLYNRSLTDPIDLEWILLKRVAQLDKCIYCAIELTTQINKQRFPNKLTIERIDNSIGHNKFNCVLACFSCNNKRQKRYTFEEFYDKQCLKRFVNKHLHKIDELSS